MGTCKNIAIRIKELQNDLQVEWDLKQLAVNEISRRNRNIEILERQIERYTKNLVDNISVS